MINQTCCFLGHREISETQELKLRLYCIIEKLINQDVDTFLFGSKSHFDSLCYEVVCALKEKYPHIKRIYVRAEFPEINSNYEDYLSERYEVSYFPDTLHGAGRSIYIKRNQEMINQSDFCIFYCIEGYSPSNRKSGTKSALEYARRKGKEIIIFP